MRLSREKIENKKYKITTQMPHNDKKCISIDINGWSCLKIDLSNQQIEKELSKLQKEFRQLLYRTTLNHPKFKNQSIVQYHSNNEGYNKNIATYFQLDIVLYNISSLTKDDINEIIDKVILILDSSDVFTYQKTKQIKNIV